ncbi:DUF6603 domain-containing protein [Streptomyces glebosus]|nr:DUF6603 domain-containing protein [Streptomyces glebosus]
MAGGSLEIVFQAGMVRAWLTAKLDVLVEWNPFYFDVGIGVRIEVSATIKVWFLRLTISVEIGASVRVWGPAVGGEATVHLWFISFTFGFGAERRSEKPALGWGGFQGMLPQPKHIIRTVPGPGYAGESTLDAAADSDTKPWLVNSGGFTFTTDTRAPVSTLYLDRDPAAVPGGRAARGPRRGRLGHRRHGPRAPLLAAGPRASTRPALGEPAGGGVRGALCDGPGPRRPVRQGQAPARGDGLLRPRPRGRSA